MIGYLAIGAAVIAVVARSAVAIGLLTRRRRGWPAATQRQIRRQERRRRLRLGLH